MSVYATNEGLAEILVDSDAQTWAKLFDCDGFAITYSVDGQTWTPIGDGGWSKSYETSKSINIAVKKKYRPDTESDKYLFSMALGDVTLHNYQQVRFTFPKQLATSSAGATLTFPCTIRITNGFSGESTDLSPLDFECISNGKPIYTPEA